MSEEPENLILVYLRRLDVKIDSVKDDVQDITIQLNKLENTVIALRRE